jgi:hypothetical protein
MGKDAEGGVFARAEDLQLNFAQESRAGADIRTEDLPNSDSTRSCVDRRRLHVTRSLGTYTADCTASHHRTPQKETYVVH